MRDTCDMGIRAAIKRAVVEALAEPELPEIAEIEVDAKLAELEKEVALLQHRLKVEERIGREYFDVIERIEKERDEWKEMFFTQASEHQNAQSILQKYLADCSGHLRAALSQLNFFRKAAELAPVANPKMLDALPTDVPEQYGEKIREMASKARPQTDGLGDRAKIASSREG